MTKEERVIWHHQLNGHEFEQTAGDGEGQGSLACCSPWGRRESDTTEQQNDKTEDVDDILEEVIFLLVFKRELGNVGLWGLRKA